MSDIFSSTPAAPPSSAGDPLSEIFGEGEAPEKPHGDQPQGLDVSEGIDFEKVLAHFPDKRGSRLFRSIMEDFRFEVGREVEIPGQGTVPVANMQVTLAGGELIVSLNPDFVRENVYNYYDLVAGIFHEMTHITAGHFIMPKIKAMFPDDFWDTPEGRHTMTVANELLVHHITDVCLPQDRYHDMFERIFREQGTTDTDRVMSRRTPPEELEDRVFQRFHERTFSQSGQFSVRETAYVMKSARPKPPKQFQDGSGQGGEGKGQQQKKGGGGGQGQGKQQSQGDQNQKGGGQQQDQKQGGQGSNGQQQDQKQGSGQQSQQQGGGQGQDQGSSSGGGQGSGTGQQKPSQQPSKKPFMGSGSSADESMKDKLKDLASALSQMIDDPPKGDDEESKAPSSSDGCTDDDVDPLVKEMVEKHRIQNIEEIRRAVKKVRIMPNLYAQIGRVIEDQMGKEEAITTTPNYRDRRQVAARASGTFYPYSRHELLAAKDKFVIYYDVSGSQEEFIPYCNEIIRRFRRHLHRSEVILFNRRIKRISTTEFTHLADQGKLWSTHGGGGTSFNVVAQDIKRHQFKKVIFLSDNRANLQYDSIEFMKKWKEKGGFMVFLETTGNWGRYYTGFKEYWDKSIRVRPVQNPTVEA